MSLNKSKLLVGVDLIRNRKGHIPKTEREMFYKEMKRAAKKKGIFVIQFPNRYFIIGSHTYLPFFGFLPSSIHSFAYRGGYVAVPSLKVVICTLKKRQFEIRDVEKYEGVFLPFGHFLSKIHLFHLLPMGYIIHARAKEGSNQILRDV